MEIAFFWPSLACCSLFFRATFTSEKVKADKPLVLGIVKRNEIKPHANKCWQSMELYFLFPRAGSGIVSYKPEEIYYLFDLICAIRFMGRVKVPRNSTSLTLYQHSIYPTQKCPLNQESS